MTLPYICDDDEKPLVLFHGTPSIFSTFSADHLNSVGFHFGCRLQAEHRIRNLNPAHIMRVHLRRGRKMAELRGMGDPGWENPAATVFPLVIAGIMTIREQHEFGFPTSSVEALRMKFTDEERRAGNARIAKFLKSKGYDSIAYSNQNEPRDGVSRDAFCVLEPNQIESLGVEQVRR